MPKILRNMVYGVLGIRVDHAMLNASFEKTAKENSQGEMYASPESIQYPIKKQFENDGATILLKRTVNEKGVLPLSEVFEKGFDKKELATFKDENTIKKALINKF